MEKGDARRVFDALAAVRESLDLARRELEAEERSSGGARRLPGEVGRPGHGDPTASAAARLSDARDRVAELERRVSAIEDAACDMLRAVPVAKWEFVARCRCLHGWDMQVVANEARVSRRTAYSYLRKALDWMDASGASAKAHGRLPSDAAQDCTGTHAPA